MQRVFVLQQIPDRQERCLPYHPCEHKVRCLRFRAEHSPGIPLGDHSSTTGGDCAKFLPLPADSRAP
jgi:hypothetical protein